MTTQYIYDLVDTWASGGGPYTSIKMNATDNDSGSASLLMDLQVGGASQASIDKRGTFSFAAPASGTAPSRPGIGNWFGTLGLFGNSGTLAATVSSTSINFGTSYQLAWNTDVILTRRAAANLRLGAADAAAPVAQTLSVQSVVAGTTNTAGTNLTITGSQGTGTGAGGSIIFQVAPAGGSGTAQNGLATAVEITSAGVLKTKEINTLGAFYLQFTNALQNSGNFATGTSGALGANGGAFVLGSNKDLCWSDTANNPAVTVDLRLFRDAAATLALRNGTAAQAFNIYNTYTSSTSFERYSVDWITTANLVIVGPNKGSVGGTQRVQRLSYLEDGGAGSTTPSLGTTCPAASATIKSWIKVITSDGTTAYVPCWA